MSIRSWLILGVVWLIFLAAVGTVVSAQVPAWRPVAEPKVLFGDDVGFRVEGMRGEVPTGVVVIKVNGNWVEVQVGGPKPDDDQVIPTLSSGSSAATPMQLPPSRASGPRVLP